MALLRRAPMGTFSEMTMACSSPPNAYREAPAPPAVECTLQQLYSRVWDLKWQRSISQKMFCRFPEKHCE